MPDDSTNASTPAPVSSTGSPGSSRKGASTAPRLKVHEGRMNAETFCKVKNLGQGIVVRLKIFLSDADDTEMDKTLAEWESVFDKAMNRVTQ